MTTYKHKRHDSRSGDSATADRPSGRSVAHLRSSNKKGGLFFLLALGLTAVAIWLAAFTDIIGWVLAQLIFSFVFIQWFVLLHEAGHYTLFPRRMLNRIAGHIASVFALIPYESWQRIHARHHRWTGWQNQDATTVALVPRPRSVIERAVVNVARETRQPLFRG